MILPIVFWTGKFLVGCGVDEKNWWVGIKVLLCQGRVTAVSHGFGRWGLTSKAQIP